MAGFATIDAYRSAMETASRYRQVAKVPGSQTTLYYYSTWGVGTMPVAGSVPTTGLAGAVATNKATVGAIEIANAPSGKNNYLARFRVDRANGLTTIPGSYIVMDRLAHANVSQVLGTGSFSPVIDGTARLEAAGAYAQGAQIFVEVTSAIATSGNVWTLTYTNQNGDTGRTTQQLTNVVSANIWKTPFADYLFVPLQAGDIGVRTVTGWNLVSGTGTGSINIVLVRPLAWINQTMFAFPNEREYGLQKMFMDRIPDDSCLFVVQAVTSASTSAVNAGLTIVSG